MRSQYLHSPEPDLGFTVQAIDERTALSHLRASYVGLDLGWARWASSDDELFRSRVHLINERFARERNHPSVALHYCNHWNGVAGYNPQHSLLCPVCYTILHDLSRHSVLEPLFRACYFGEEIFSWHYDVRWEGCDMPEKYSLDRDGRLALQSANSASSGPRGWLYHNGSEIVAIQETGAKADFLRPTPYDRLGSRSIPHWLRINPKL